MTVCGTWGQENRPRVPSVVLSPKGLSYRPSAASGVYPPVAQQADGDTATPQGVHSTPRSLVPRSLSVGMTENFNGMPRRDGDLWCSTCKITQTVPLSARLPLYKIKHRRRSLRGGGFWFGASSPPYGCGAEIVEQDSILLGRHSEKIGFREDAIFPYGCGSHCLYEYRELFHSYPSKKFPKSYPSLAISSLPWSFSHLRCCL